MSPLPSLARKLFVGLVVLVLVLLACELAARLTFPAPHFVRDLPYDPELGFAPRANVNAPNADAEGSFPFRTNRLGFRGPVPSAKAAEGGRRVVFLGDGFLVGWQVREEELAPFTVARALSEDAGAPVEAFALACDGYGTLQQWLLLRRHANELAPDDVVLCFDLGDDFTGNSLALARQSPSASGAGFRPFARPAFEPGDPGGPVEWWSPERTRLRRVSRAFQLIEHRLLRLGREGRGATDAAAGVLEPLLREGGEARRAALRPTHVALTLLREEVGRLGAELLVAIVPHRGQVQLDASSLAGTARETAFDGELRQRAVEELAHSLGIRTLTLAGALRRATEAEGRSMYQHDGTWSGAGHRAAGRAIARALRGEAPEESGVEAPVDLPARVLALPGGVDFRAALHAELLGPGFHTWRSDWWGSAAGWLASAEAWILVPNVAGTFRLDGWLPDHAELPFTLEVAGTVHRVESHGDFTLSPPWAPYGDAPYGLVRLASERTFAFRRAQGAFVLRGYELEPAD